MGYVDVSAVRHTLSDGRVLLDEVSFRVGEGARAALVGENGAGKTTLLRIIAGDLSPEAGAIARTGGATGDEAVTAAVGRLAPEYAGRVGPHLVVRVVRTARKELGGSPVGAMPELVERLARYRLDRHIA